MKRILFAAVMGAIAAPVGAADVGVSVNVGQPGFYGRIDIGNAPRPQLVYPEPVVIERAPGNAPRPVYLYVPPEHAKDWRKHCHRYNACGQPVYFVQRDWYENVYVPHYRASHAQVVYAHDIHSDVVRARVIWAHAVHAREVRARVVYESDWKGEPKGKGKGKDKDKGHGEDIHAEVVAAGEIHAHDIHARIVEAETLYVKDLHTKR
jgi:hypothetical protein